MVKQIQEYIDQTSNYNTVQIYPLLSTEHRHFWSVLILQHSYEINSDFHISLVDQINEFQYKILKQYIKAEIKMSNSNQILI